MGFGNRDTETSADLLSGSAKYTDTKVTRPMEARMIKIDCHPNIAVTYPPVVGAIIGDTATTSISKENIFAFSFTGNISRTIALAATIPAQPPNACNNLIAISASAEVHNAQPIEASTYKVNPK
jgi:hypothetical protein